MSAAARPFFALQRTSPEVGIFIWESLLGFWQPVCNFFTISHDCYSVCFMWKPFVMKNKLAIEGDWQAMPFILNKQTDTRWHTCHRELR